MDLIDLWENYYDLARFLGYFDVNQFDDSDLPYDEQKVLDCEVRHLGGEQWDREYFEPVRRQADAILAMDPFPARAVGGVAGQYFETPEECRAWLIRILDEVERRIKATEG